MTRRKSLSDSCVPLLVGEADALLLRVGGEDSGRSGGRRCLTLARRQADIIYNTGKDGRGGNRGGDVAGDG